MVGWLMSSGTDDTALAGWKEWREMCALARCADSTRRQLQSFALARFRRMVRVHVAGVVGARTSSLLPAVENVWHLFESHLVVRGTDRGKRYKDWLFARTAVSDDDPLAVIESGATLIMRDVVREYRRRELPWDRSISMDQPLGGAGAELTMHDLLPGTADPVEEIGRREYERLSRRHARDLFGGMPVRTRIALLARGLGLPLSHREVEKAAGCSKSTLSATFRDAMKTAAEALRSQYPADDTESLLSLTLMTLCEVKRLALAWGKAQNDCVRLFTTVGEGVVDGVMGDG